MVTQCFARLLKRVLNKHVNKTCLFIDYLPIQNSRKIRSRISSDVTVPMSFPRFVRALRRYSAIITKSGLFFEASSRNKCKCCWQISTCSRCLTWFILGCSCDGSPHLIRNSTLKAAALNNWYLQALQMFCQNSN